MTTKVEYLSCSVTAKLVRGALKKAFPGTKFSVRSETYAGGASINVRWIDGPTTSAVDKVAGAYASGGFDGMIDLKYSSNEWLMPDGSATAASSRGTQGSMGSVPAYDYPAPGPEARLVHFGADYVFTKREHSVEALTEATKKVCEEWGFPMPVIEKWNDGTGHIKNGWMLKVPNASEDLQVLVNREMAKEPA